MKTIVNVLGLAVLVVVVVVVNKERAIEATSTSDALDFLELSESVQMCLDF